MANRIAEIQVLVAPRSVEGMKAAGACFRNNHQMQLLFTDNLSTVNMAAWPSGTKVGLLDLPASVDFVNSGLAKHHKIIFIAARASNSWDKIFTDSPEAMPVIWTASGSETCCDLLSREFGAGADPSTKALLQKDNNIYDDCFSKAYKEMTTGDLFTDYVKYTALLDLV